MNCKEIKIRNAIAFPLLYVLHLSLIITLSFLVLTSCRSKKEEKKPSSEEKTKRIAESIEVDGRTRNYILHVPEKVEPDSSLPVVFVLHGGRGSPENIEKISGFHRQDTLVNFITVYPASLNKYWNDGRTIADSAINDVRFINHLIDTLQARYPVHREGIFSAGLSNGGTMSVRLACESESIHATATVASTAVKKVIDHCNPGKPKSSMIIQGAHDPVTSIRGVQKSKRKIVSHKYAIQQFLSLNHCNSHFTSNIIPDTSGGRASATKKIYNNCRDRAEVVSIIVENAGHTWPGGEQYRARLLVGRTSHAFNASEVIWDFFRRQIP